MRKLQQRKKKKVNFDQSCDRYSDQETPIHKYQNQFIYQNIGQSLDFVNHYHNIKSIPKINRDIHSHNILCIDTKIFKQLKQIEQQFQLSRDEKGMCLRQRSIKLLQYFKQIQEFCYHKQFEKNLNKSQLTKLIDVYNNDIKINSKIGEVKVGKKSEIISKYAINKNEAVNNQVCQKKQKYINQFISHRYDKNHIEQNNDQSKQNNPHLVNRHANFKQNQKSTNNNIPNIIPKKILSVSPNKIINIHEVLKSTKQQRCQDNQKQKLNQQFKQKIEKSITQINRELREIKQKQTYNEESLSDMKIQQLENQIKSLNQKNSHTTSSHLNTTKTIRLDLSRKKKESRLTPQKSTQDARNSLSRDKKINKSQITIRTQIVQKIKKSPNKSNLTPINKNNSSYLSKDKTIQIKNNQIDTQIKKNNQSTSQKVIPVKKKLLLTARIAQISRN